MGQVLLLLELIAIAKIICTTFAELYFNVPTWPGLDDLIIAQARGQVREMATPSIHPLA